MFNDAELSLVGNGTRTDVCGTRGALNSSSIVLQVEKPWKDSSPILAESELAELLRPGGPSAPLRSLKGRLKTTIWHSVA